MPKTAMILAAGRGVRMGALTVERPKPLLSIANRALVDYVIERLLAVGVTRIVVNLHHHADQLRSRIAAMVEPFDGIDLRFSDEGEALLDTGGGVAKALPLIDDDPFYVVNGDAVWFDGGRHRMLEMMRARFDAATMDALLLLAPTVGAFGYRGRGDFEMASDGRLLRRIENEVAPFVFTGVQVLSRAAFDGMPSGAYSLNRIYDRAAEAERLFGLRLEGDWMTLNTPRGLAAAERALKG